MEAINNVSSYSVTVSNREVCEFAAGWPGHNLDTDAEYQFEFDIRNGDLIDIGVVRDGTYWPLSDDEDGDAFVAMSEDAGRIGAEHLDLSNVLDIRYPNHRSPR